MQEKLKNRHQNVAYMCELHLQRARVLGLWSVALSADSAAALDIRCFVAEPSPAWDIEMAAEMWWRASALEALQVSYACRLRDTASSELPRSLNKST